VLMADDGFKSIESIELCVFVKNKHTKAGNVVAGKLLRKFRSVAPLLLALTFGNGEVITTTPSHPFATQADGAFVPAAELTVGETVVQSGGSFAQLKTESEQRGTFATYNFEVEKYHTYFVGKSKVWVHNACSAKLNRALGGDIG
jgi:hypothetical protein